MIVLAVVTVVVVVIVLAVVVVVIVLAVVAVLISAHVCQIVLHRLYFFQSSKSRKTLFLQHVQRESECWFQI